LVTPTDKSNGKQGLLLSYHQAEIFNTKILLQAGLFYLFWLKLQLKQPNNFLKTFSWKKLFCPH